MRPVTPGSRSDAVRPQADAITRSGVVGGLVGVARLRASMARQAIIGLWRLTPFPILIATALTPVAWMYNSLPIKGVDSMFSLHPQGRLFYSLFSAAWDARVSVGEPSDGHIWIFL